MTTLITKLKDLVPMLTASIGFLGAVLLILAIIVCIPLAFIWAVNTLFGLGIEFTVPNLLAALVLVALLGSSGYSKGK